MAVSSTAAYYDTAKITVVKSLMVQAQGVEKACRGQTLLPISGLRHSREK
jgi:hypothetical protein